MRADIDRAVGRLAAEQWGVWTGGQGARVGSGRRLASRRVLKGLWIRPYPDTYAHQSWVRPAEGLILAAAWSLGDGLAGLRSAGFLHGLCRPPGEPEIVVIEGAQRDRPFRIRRTRLLRPWDRAIVRRVPCTSLERTLVDLAEVWSEDDIGDAWDHALTSRRTTLTRLEHVALPLVGRGVAGSAVVDRLITARTGKEPAASTLERVLYEILESGTYGRTERQAPLPSFTGVRGAVDALLPDLDLIVEADGRRWHTRVGDFERDRRRDNEAQALGYDVARFTYRQLTEARDEVFAILDQHFHRRGYRRTAAGLWVPGP
jgi:very-short-patch-repair endonuclease